jgi:transcriptional regulator
MPCAHPHQSAKSRPPIDLGLAVLSTLRTPSQVFTQEQIADICECHRGRISQIEKKALLKIRHRLRWGHLKNILKHDDLSTDLRSGS